MSTDQRNDTFSDEETQRRVEAAIRGARIVGHKPMKEVAAQERDRDIGVKRRRGRPNKEQRPSSQTHP